MDDDDDDLQCLIMSLCTEGDEDDDMAEGLTACLYRSSSKYNWYALSYIEPANNINVIIIHVSYYVRTYTCIRTIS